MLPLLLFVVVFATGCAGTRTLDAENPQPLFDKINRLGAEKTARVTLTTGRIVEAEALRVRADSTTWVRADNEISETVPTSDLHEVQFTRRLFTSIVGAAVGVGAGIGLSFLAEDSGVRRTVLLGGGVGLLGFGVGRFNPIRQTFRFPRGRTLSQPDGS